MSDAHKNYLFLIVGIILNWSFAFC